MLNQIILVGRLVNDPTIKELEDGRKTSTITLAIQRAYKNAEGIYDTDFIDCTLWTGIAENTVEYCHKGDVIGVKGRMQTRTIEDNKNVIEVVAEKVTFLSSARKDKEEGEE